MSYNRSLLSQITKDLNKKPSKPKVPKNQWQHPGEITNIPSNSITMDAVSYPVLGVPNVGQPQMMYPDQQYYYPDADNVTEYPMMGSGGYVVTRSNDRKGKTHKVTGPDGTVKYFGDSSMGQHPKDPKRKKAFYARHKKNLENNPFFRAFARKTWAEGGQTSDEREMVNGIADILSQVEDRQNRAEIARQMMSDFNRDNVTYNAQSFLDMAELKNGGEMIRRADGSYSRRGLWDNIRANKGSGKKPTKEMLEQERKIKSKMQFGGLWDSNRTAWVDSVNNANMDKNFVQRMYNPNAPQMFLPGDKRPSTHFMESGDARAYPTVIQRPGNKYVEWLNQNNPNAAYNYASNSGQYIQFPNDVQANWYAANGYKQGTNVVTGKQKKQYGGAMKKYQTAGQVIKPKNGFVNLTDYGYKEFTPEFMAKAEELNKLYPGTQFQCTANGCADIATKVAGAYGHNFGRFNAWDAGNQNPVAFINPSYTEQMLTGKEPLPNPKSYAVPAQMQGMENKIITMNRNNNLVDAKGNKLKINPQNILLGKSPYVKGSNDSFDYKYNYLRSRGMEHAGYLKGNKTLIHGTAANKEHPAFFIFDDLADGIKLPGYGQYEAVEAIDEPSAIRRNWNDVANGFGAVKQNIVDLFTAATNPADIIKEGTNLYNKYTKTNKKGNIARSNPASMIPSFIPNVSQVPRIFNKGINFAERSLDKARRAIPVGESIIDYLGNQGVKYDKATRRAIANHLGIKDYNFSAAKNIELMKRIAQAPEILDRFVHPKAQFGGIGIPNFSALLPSNIQTFGKYVGSALGVNADPIVQKNDFTKENLRAIYNAAQAAKKRTGSNHGGTKYVDYGQSYNNIWNKGVPEILKGNSIVQKVGKLPFRAYNMIKDTMLDPTYQAATSTGRFTYDINPDGSVRVKDNYDFDQESDGVFNAIDKMLGKKDYRRNIGFTINPKDIKRQGGLIKAQTLGEFKGVNTQPLTGAPASAWATGWTDNTTTDPYKVQQTGFVVNQQQATTPVKADNTRITPQWAVKANNFLNKVEKADDFISDLGDGVFNAFNVFAQKTAMGNQSDREEANRQMLRAQNASWNQQYNDTMNRGNFSQGPSSYGMFRPNQTFAQQGIEVPVSMDTVSKYTVDSFDEAAGINTIGIGTPEFDFSSMRAQPNDMSPAQEAPEQTEPSYEAPEGNLREIIAQRESLGNYQALPRRKDGTLASSAAGKYQFLWDTHKDTIRTVTGVNSKSQFLNSPKAQEAYFDYWDQNVLTPKAQKIKQQYNPNLDTNQIKMLIHFQGPEGAEKYIRTGKYTKDAFGTTPMSYLTKNISTKKGVNTNNLDPNLKSFASAMSDYFPGLKISSGNDSKHMRGSKHYANKAIDIGANSSDPAAYNRLTKFLAQNPSIKRQYGIEDIINEGDHLHIELMQQGGEYELTADQIMQIKAMGGDVEFL